MKSSTLTIEVYGYRVASIISWENRAQGESAPFCLNNVHFKVEADAWRGLGFDTARDMLLEPNSRFVVKEFDGDKEWEYTGCYLTGAMYNGAEYSATIYGNLMYTSRDRL